MTYKKFISYNVIGGFLWIYFFTYMGFFFGELPFIQKNFKIVILAIIVLSVMPIVWEFTREWLKRRKEKNAAVQNETVE